MTNKEFLFIFDAALSNPNGDPDTENKPRMDRATKTNLVSDTRLKRTIRDYLISKFDNEKNAQNDVFVRMMGEQKVSVEKRLMGVVVDYLQDRIKLEELKVKHSGLQIAFEKLRSVKDKDSGSSEEEGATKSKKRTEPFKGDDFELYHSFIKKDQELTVGIKTKELGEVNNELLTAIIKDTMIDSRFFGGAFAVGGFSKTVIGSIQVNTGYSLHPVELNPSNSIVTIMGDKEGQSGIGKKETLFYSLISHTGTINAKRGAIVNLSEEDLKQFREAIILSILDWRSDSKKNQYPRLYLEIDYKENEIYGRLGDLRNLINVTSNVDTDFSKVRSIKDVNIDFTELVTGLEKIKAKVQKIRIWNSLDGSCDKLETLLKERFEEQTIEQLTI
ncbi:type I CRISPR-associated protein Cas7 [Runella sp.]|uniref:type I CRISPR-associated protein Cas7 n=1 Tax=Runella sp. TaxID=1960881 RepID=UPI002619E927|nr:type I CRISPR-associated protein Cas7 [Runella sp.]